MCVCLYVENKGGGKFPFVEHLGDIENRRRRNDLEDIKNRRRRAPTQGIVKFEDVLVGDIKNPRRRSDLGDNKI